MKEYKLEAIVTAQIEMTLKADTEEEARRIFCDNMMITASISDFPADRFDAMDESISALELSYVQELKPD